MKHDPTAVADVLAHVTELSVQARNYYHELVEHGKTLAFDSEQDRCNWLEQRYAAGQMLALAKVEGYLEARIQIDTIWSGLSTGEIIDPLANRQAI